MALLEEHVRISDDSEGSESRWHVVDPEAWPEGDEAVYVTLCGRRVPFGDEEDFSPTGDRPDDLSMSTTCYDCADATDGGQR